MLLLCKEFVLGSASVFFQIIHLQAVPAHALLMPELSIQASVGVCQSASHPGSFQE